VMLTTGTWVEVELVGKGTQNTDVDGNFTFVDVVPAGTHTIRASATAASNGEKTNINVSSAQTTDIGTITLIAGDGDNDGNIGAMDFWMMWRAFYNYNPEADFNHDGRINGDDFTILYNNFFKGTTRSVRTKAMQEGGKISLSSIKEVMLGETFTATLNIDTDNMVAGESIIQFDPKFLEFVKVEGKSSLWNAAKLEDGRIRLIFGVNLGEKARRGQQEVISLVFKAKKLGKTSIVPMDSMVVKEGEGASLSEEKVEILIKQAVPSSSALFQSFPNPAENGCWIPYQLAKDADVSLIIYNIVGQKVAEVNAGYKPAGFYTKAEDGCAIFWDGKNSANQPVAQGLYFYQLKAGDFTATRSMILRK
ncbi:MAG: cohesin domain-containing protein, partial [bacterium]